MSLMHEQILPFLCSLGFWLQGLHMSHSPSSVVSWTLEDFGSLGLSTFTVAASVHDSPIFVCGTVASAVPCLQ